MTNELIEKYVAPRQVGEKEIKIFFKQRSTITGIFIKGADYDELRSKNFWRIVTNANINNLETNKRCEPRQDIQRHGIYQTV